MGDKMCLDELRSQARIVLAVELGKNAVEVLMPLMMPTVKRMLTRRLPTEHPEKEYKTNYKR